MSGLCIGILGLGSIGLRHACNLKSLGHHVLGYDPSAQACERFVEDTGCENVDRKAILARADALVIASPNGYHLSDLSDAIDAGKPVLVEKPLGHDHGPVTALLDRAEELGCLVAVAQNLRFRAVVRRVRALIEAGEAGQPIWANFVCGSWLPDWREGSDYRANYAADPETGGVIFDSIHEIDLAVHLLGPAHVSAATAGNTGLLDMPSEDIADIQLEHVSGCRTQIHLDYVTRPRRRHFTIAGRKGILIADLRSGEITITGPEENVAVSETHSHDVNDEYVAEMENFLGAVAGETPSACPAREALDILRIACNARSVAGLPSAPATQQEPAL